MGVRMTKKEYTGMSEKTPETIIEKIAKYSAERDGETFINIRKQHGWR